MNRLLLQEWLDELRSDDSVELTESQKHPHGKKRNSPHHGNRAAPSLDGSSRGFPDSSRSTASSTPALTERRRQSIANVTNDVKRKILNYLNGDRKIDEKDYKRAIGDLRATFSLEYKGGSSYGPIATPSGIMGLRVADHRAVGEHFPQNEGDFYVSIYIGEGEAAHIPTAVPYKEFYCPKVLFDRNPKKVLRAAVGIVLNAIETGELVDKTATFTMKDYPVEVQQGAQAAIQTQAGLSPQPPATPPTGPGVQAPPPAPPATPPTGPGVLESLAAKYFKEAHNMKYRLLKEAVLRELMEEDDLNLVSMINPVDEPENYDGMGRPMISKPPKNPLSCAAIEFWVKSKKPRLEPEQYGSMDEIVLAQRYLEENGIDSESLDRETFKAVQRYIAELVSKYGGHRPL